MADTSPHDNGSDDHLREIVTPLAQAAVQKNKFNNRRWRALFGLLLAAFAWLGWNNYNLNTTISHQHETVVREATLTTQDRALYCAQGTFLSQIIHVSVANPQPGANPQALATVNAQATQLDHILSQVCK